MPDTAPACRFPTKRLFTSAQEAAEGVAAIRDKVLAAGGNFDPLYPYPCPDDGTHWHLSHYQQGAATCPSCGELAPAWNGGAVWVIGAHGPSGPCAGTGQHSPDPVEVRSDG